MIEMRRAAEIAERLEHHLGREAISFVSTQIEAARQASDQDRLRLWNEVARTLTRIDDPSVWAAERRDGCRSLWGFMQWIEHCRHRAMEAERKAAAAPEAYRQDMIDLARQWREVALHTDLLRQALDVASAQPPAERHAA